MPDTYIPKIALLSEEIKLIKDCVQIYFPNSKIFIFGSRVRGTAKKYSDIDIALDNQKFIPTQDLAKIKLTLEDKLPYFVDIIDLQNISPEFKSAIQSQLKEI